MFVLDASVVVASFFVHETHHTTATQLLRMLYQRIQRGAPISLVYSDLLVLEVETVLWRAARVEQTQPPLALKEYEKLTQLLAQQITPDFVIYKTLSFQKNKTLLETARAIASTQTLKLPDALYLAQCQLYGAQLISFDNQQRRAAQALGLLANIEMDRL